MTQSADLILFGVIAVALFAAGHLLARKRRAAHFAGGRPDDMLSLNEAAEAVCKAARDERMPLAVVAERNGNPLMFFARSIASVISTWKQNGAGGFNDAKGDGDTQSLYIRRRDIGSYLRWARTVK
ncbi:MAG TPA: hypothetical protein VGH02_09470 [Rhizomicrobium sp.]|jgi:hypothetical protein